MEGAEARAADLHQNVAFSHRAEQTLPPQFTKIMHDIYDSLKMTGKLGSHVLRKTYALRLYKIFNRDLVKVQRAINHENINSTCRYVQDFTDADIEQAILST